jgi:phospholipase/carboxylesterase
MTDTPEIDGPRAEPARGGAAKQLVVLLHGLGADGNDLIALAPHLQQVLPEAAIVSPHAHEACDMAPMGRQWFSMQDMSTEAMFAGARTAAPVVDAFLDAELQRHGLGADKLALCGFSQGGMMALHCGLRRDPAPAAICGFSTLLLGADALGQELRGKPPVLLTHGSADEVIPAKALAHTQHALEALGLSVESETREGLGHGLDEACLRRAMAFLQRHLGDP